MNQIIPAQDHNDTELTDLDLLADALHQALAAHGNGRLIGHLDQVAMRRAERRARRSDVARLLRTPVSALVAEAVA